MTIDDVIEIADPNGVFSYTMREQLRAAILALLDAEAWACQSVVHSSLVGVMTCDANGHPVTEYVKKHEAIAAIRARIAARKGGANT
jgi:hypothetical protein